MRWLVVLLVALLLALQYKLWVADGGLGDVWRIGHEVRSQKQTNEEVRERNQALEGEVRDLKQGLEAIEERARTELGMIRDGETFYQIVDPKKSTATGQPSRQP